MHKPEHFEIMEGYAVYRPTGMVSLQQTVQLITLALGFARDNKIKKLLVVITGLTGFEPPSVASRYFFIQEWAHAAQGNVCLAMVAKPEMIDPQKFGVLVGKNFGLRSDVFASEEEGLAWLQTIT